MSPATISERDSLVIESNERFSDVSIVGVGAEVITNVKEKSKE